MKRLLRLSLVASSCAAQTTVPLATIRPPSAPTVTIVAYINDPASGKATIVPVLVSGPGFTLLPPTTPGGAYVLRILGSTQPTWENEVFIITAPAPTLQLIVSPGSSFPIQVMRNGLTLTSGVDYTLSGSTLTFLVGAVPGPGDIVRVLYQR
jgi:hypothetical protein